MKRISFFFIGILSITIGLFSCSKEYSLENLSTFNNPAAGSLPADSIGLCNKAYVNGNYYVGNSLNISNYALVYVNVASVGKYKIATNVMNGMYFIDSGYFNNTGIQQIELKGIGIPVVPDTTTFTLSFGTYACSFTVNNVFDTSSSNSYFKLVDSAGICNTITVHGVYTVGTPTDSSNYLVARINAITPGNYTIGTSISNGISFTTSGLFLQKGIQSVTIPAVGTPQTKGANTFTLISSTGNCTFPVITH